MSRERTAILIACATGTVCLFGLLTFLSVRNRSNPPKPAPPPTPVAPAPPRITYATPKQQEPLVPYGGGISVSASHRQRVEQGDAYGHKGDWQKAFECFRELVTSGNAVEYEWVCATGAALAAGDTNECEQFCIKLMGTLGQSNSTASAERFAKQCLALPHCSEELLEQAAERADFVVKKGRNNAWGQLVKGMAEYRLENWSAALKWLRQVENSSDMDYSIMGCCFGAMARHQLGDASGARKALVQANNRVKVLVVTGKLGSWNDIARAIGVRAEAEQLILGKIVSPPLNPSELIANREKWKAVDYSLNAADKMASQSQWVPAAEYYTQAMQDPAFDWSVSELKQDLVAQQMGTTFLIAGDQTRYCSLVSALLARKVEHQSPGVHRRNGFIFVCGAEMVPADLKNQALAYVRRACESPEADIDPWFRLLRGQTEYREGHFDTAIETAGQTFFPPAASDGAARAMVLKAMALKRLGRTKEALEATQEANAHFAKQTTQNAPWVSRAFFQLEMKELLELLANTGEPLKRQ